MTAAAGAEPWRSVIGRPLTDVATVWHQPGESPDRYLWSVRLCFADDKSVVLALGAPRAGDLEYMPDELLVIKDPHLARMFRIPGATQPAWGADDHDH